MSVGGGGEQPTPARRSLRGVTVWCILGYVVLACLIFWPALPWNDSRLPSVPWGGYGYGDPAQMSWYLSWTPYALLHGLNPLHTTFLDYPSGANLASNTSSPLLGVIASPFSLTLGPVAAFNVMIRLAFAASASSMFLVLRTWCRWSVAAVGGLFYGFSPYVVTQVTHLNLAFVPMLPAIVWALYELVSAKRYRPSSVGLLLGVFVGAQVLIDPELVAMMAVVVVPSLLVLAVIDRHSLRSRFNNLVVALPFALAVVGVLDGYYVWWMLAGPGHVNGPPLPVAVLQNLRADVLSPVVPTLNQYLLPKSLVTVASRFDGGNFTENCGYLGLGLIAWTTTVAVRFRRSRVIRYSALAAVAALVLSLGNRLTFNAHVTTIPLPEALVYRLPLFNRFVPSRFAVLVMLFVVVAGSVGAEEYLRRERVATSPRTRLDEAAMAAILLLAIAMAIPQVALTTKPPNWPRATQSALSVIPRGAVVLTYPFPFQINTEALSWQAQDRFRFRLLGGNVNVPGTDGFGRYFANPLDPSSIQSFFVSSVGGAADPYSSRLATGSLRGDLCQMASRYHIGAIIFWRQGSHPERVRDLIESAFGQPLRAVGGGTFDVWVTSSRRCEDT